MSKPYHTLYTSCFCILLSMPHVSLATQSNDIDTCQKIVLSVDTIHSGFDNMNDKEAKNSLLQNRLSYMYTNPSIRYTFFVRMKTLQKSNSLLYESIQKKLKKTSDDQKFSLCPKIKPKNAPTNYPHIYCFMPNDTLWDTSKTTTFYIVRLYPKFYFNKLHFDRTLSIIRSSLDIPEHLQRYKKSLRTNHGIQIYFEDVFPLTTTKIKPPITILPKSTSKKIFSTKKEALKTYVKLTFSAFNKDTEQFITKYSVNKTGNATFTFEKYSQNLRCLALRKEFAEKILVFAKVLKNGIHPSFIYLYNDKKEKINLSKKDIANYDPPIKELWKKGTLDKKQKSKGWTGAFMLSLFYKITYYPQLFKKS